jgi:hypothetical protein
MKEKIIDFLSNEFPILEFDMCPVDTIKDVLILEGYTMEDDWDTNGWDHDFWIKFEHPEKPTIQFAGSWYYGNYNLFKI